MEFVIVTILLLFSLKGISFIYPKGSMGTIQTLPLIFFVSLIHICVLLWWM